MQKVRHIFSPILHNWQQRSVFGRPPFHPRARDAAKSALVRSTIILRSNFGANSDTLEPLMDHCKHRFRSFVRLALNCQRLLSLSEKETVIESQQV